MESLAQLVDETIYNSTSHNVTIRRRGQSQYVLEAFCGDDCPLGILQYNNQLLQTHYGEEYVHDSIKGYGDCLAASVTDSRAKKKVRSTLYTLTARKS